MSDPFSWLEEVDGQLALDWVRERDAETERWLATGTDHAELQASIRAVLDARDQPILPRRRADLWYDFRQDQEHPRGVWRRTTLEELRSEEPAWETVLDIDALAAEEGVPWTFAGGHSLPPDHRICLVHLSRGGSDAHEIREFDLVEKRFVDGGFRVPEGKTRSAWLDEDTLLLGADLGPGSMTRSGYPRQIRRWRRGTALEDAPVVFEGKADDVQVFPHVDHTPGFHRVFVWRIPSFHQYEGFLLEEDLTRATAIPAPPTAQLSVWREWALIRLSEPWGDHPTGSLVVARFDELMAGRATLQRVFEPGPRTSLEGWSTTRNLVLLDVLDDVKSRVLVASPERTGWTFSPVPDLPANASITMEPEEGDRTDVVWVRTTDYLTPVTNDRVDVATGEREAFRGGVHRFDASPFHIEQHHARSPDGTVVPYFQISRKDLVRDGSHPTCVYGYGGFEISLTPSYSSTVGLGWLQRGGVWVVANIRGGGEFGPAWHRAALRDQRPRAYEDFEAVVADLIDRGVTSAGRVGAMGGSNGGLLVGNLLVRRPELYGAVVSTVPLLDMRRYHLLLAGASWMEEYGDPDDPADWAYLEQISPYHRVQPDVSYPPSMFVTSTRDDRVHPGHARKMVARMRWQGHDVRYYESIEGGHAAGSTNEQRAFMLALEYTFLWRHLSH
ncbi:MAG: S9 family peptidase [Alphaproteobacteria bacterium]|nr:S9 family peptidase [Alphaproteobacteria bacterium]MCB9698372.1 S9 family peptidase [Alphaproteobacteria bacterium]